MECPKCQCEMLQGYSSANSSLSWIDADAFRSFIFKDTDLARSGLKNLFPWKGEYFQAHNCPQCEIVLIDYSQKYDRKAIAAEKRR